MTHATSAQGLALIQQYEGFRHEPAQLPDGNWVVGYGHVRIGEAGPAVSQSEAADLLALDLAPVERLVNGRVTQELNQSQFDALVSFAFSVGAEAFEQSQVLRRTNSSDFVAAACAMDAWRKSDVGGELAVVDTLVRRRVAEKSLYLAELPHDASPSVFVRPKLDYAASVLGAPVAYAITPAVGSIPVAQPKLAPALVLTEILKSEPATEALLLTQVVAEDSGEVDADEIVTAHAKPVARSLDDVREATRLSFNAQQAEANGKSRFSWFKRDAESPTEATPAPVEVDRRIRQLRTQPESGYKLPGLEFILSFENFGLFALLIFGLALLAIGGSLVIGGEPDFVAMLAAAAVITPGLAACLMAAVGLLRPEGKVLGI